MELKPVTDQFIETAKKFVKEVKRLDENVRSHNVGSSDYAKQDSALGCVDHHLNPWDIKVLFEGKKGQNRKEDFEKFILHRSSPN